MHSKKDINGSPDLQLTVRGKNFRFDEPLVMGILNLTPDSFFDGGKYRNKKEIIAQVEMMLVEGASIIDIGAVSTRPGAREITEKEEWQRLETTLKMIAAQFPDAIISIDTYRSGVAEKAVHEGAHIINDISGGTFDKLMPAIISRLKIPFVMMHIQGTPQNMQFNPRYENVVEEVKAFFIGQLNIFSSFGILENIILDPGFGFGKTVEHNYQLLRSLRSMKDLGYPVMAGLSRKSMINKVLEIKPQDALNGTTALNVIALLNGADILRVHDVKEAKEAIRLVKIYQSSDI